MIALRLIATFAVFAATAASASDLSLRLDPHLTRHSAPVARPPVASAPAAGSSNASSSNTNSSNARAASKSRSDATASASSTSRGGSAVGVGSQGQSLSVDNHAVYQAQDRNPVSSAVAPALMTSNDTCMGSTSVGATAVSFGLSVGSTWTDNNCLMLKNARELWNMGFKGAALARLCMDDMNREALEAAGMACPERRTKVVDSGSNGRDEASEFYRY